MQTMIKNLVPLLLALMLATVAHAGDMTIKTLDGQTYEHATITAVAPDGLNVTYDAGVVKIPFANLPVALQTQYGYNPTKAAAYQSQEALAGQIQARQQASAPAAQSGQAPAVNSQAAYERKQKIAAIDKEAVKMAWAAYNSASANMVQGDLTRSQREIDTNNILNPRTPNDEIATLTAKYKAQLMKQAGLAP